MQLLPNTAARRSFVLIGSLLLAVVASTSAQQTLWLVNATYIDSGCKTIVSYSAVPTTSCGSVSTSPNCVAASSFGFGFESSYCGSVPSGGNGIIQERFDSGSCQSKVTSRYFSADGCFSVGFASVKSSCSGTTYTSDLCPGDCNSGCRPNPFFFGSTVPVPDGTCRNSTKTRCGNASAGVSIAPALIGSLIGAAIYFVL
jgi:hypothetical protein